MTLYGTSHTVAAFLNAQVATWASLQRNGSGGGKPAAISALLQRPYFATVCARLLADPMQFDLAWAQNDNRKFDGACVFAVDADVQQKLRTIGEALNTMPAVRERLAANGCARNTTIGASRVWYAITRDEGALREIFRTNLTREELGERLEKRYEFVDFFGDVQTVVAAETAPQFLVVTHATFPRPAVPVTLQKRGDDWHVSAGERIISPKKHITQALKQLSREMQGR